MRASCLLPLSSLLLAFFAAQAHAADPLTVKTDKGKVEGAYTLNGEVRAFKGIPYAAPPVGDLRWQPPQPAHAWHDTLEATDFGHHCIQFGGYPDMVFHDPGPSEDCLTLNVWTPAHAQPGTKPGSLPVMVWIYGGGFVTGGTSEARQDGEFLAHRNVIIVSMNYRLGMLGFLALPALAAESPHHAAGNYGLLDQAAALAWVHHNIRAFGGDPGNITLFGESAGSFSVSVQMASPLSKRFLSKAIGESGAAFSNAGLSFGPLAQTEAHDSSFLQKTLGTSSLTDLRKIPAEKLAANPAFRSGQAFPQDIDGYFLPAPVPTLYERGEEAHIPLLAGWNEDEMRAAVLFAKVKPTPESFAAQARKDFGSRADSFLSLYPAKTDAEALRSAGDFASDRFIVYSTWIWLEAHVKTGDAPTFRYRFDLPNPGDKNHPAAMGAFHSDEIEYVFGTLDSRPDAHWRPEDRKLSDQMGQYWTNFARTGNPNGPGLPQWPTYGPTDDWQVMHLDPSPAAKPDALRDRYLFLESLSSGPGTQ